MAPGPDPLVEHQQGLPGALGSPQTPITCIIRGVRPPVLLFTHVLCKPVRPKTATYVSVDPRKTLESCTTCRHWQVSANRAQGTPATASSSCQGPGRGAAACSPSGEALARRVVKTGLPRDVQRREGINGAKRLKTQRRIQGGVDQRPRAESPQTRGSSEQEESVCVSRGRGLSPGAEGGAPCVCGRAGVGGEGHTPCRGRLCLPTEWVCLGSTPLPGGRHPQMDGGVHVVLDMETELGTDPRTSSHGEQRSQGWAS